METLTSTKILPSDQLKQQHLQIQLLTIETNSGRLFWYNNYTLTIDTYDTHNPNTPPTVLVNVTASDSITGMNIGKTIESMAK